MSKALAAVFAVTMALFASAPSGALAQAYPNKPIRLVVPFPPGGGVDFTARLISQRLGANLGQPIVVDNRAGAAGAIGDEAVSKAAPDGYLLLYSVGSDMMLRKLISRTATLDPLRDLTPVATAVGSLSCIVASPSLPVTTLKEFIAYAKRNPGKLTYGSAGVASYQHLTGELLKQYGVDMVHVPFKGLAPALSALMGGQIDVAITNFPTALPQLGPGKARAIAVLDAKRYAGTPDVPTVGEELPGFNMPTAWFGFFGPPALAQPIVARLNSEVARALEAPEVATKLRDSYVTTVITPAEQMRPLLTRTGEAFARLIKAAGIQQVD